MSGEILSIPNKPISFLCKKSVKMNKIDTDVISDAEEYTLFGHPNTTMQECDFLEDIINVSGCSSPTLLDIACGPGRHALEMTRRGYSVTGIDISASMISAARESSTAEVLQIEFIELDMREMEFSSQFDIAYVLFNTLGLITSNEEILNFLSRIYDALQPDGLFIFQVGNLWSYMAEGNFSNSVYESEQENRGVKRKLVMKMIIGPYNNVYRMHYDKRFWRGGRKLQSKSENVDLRIFSLNELDLLLEFSGFQRLKVFGATDLASVIDNPDQISGDENPFHSYVVLAMKTCNEVVQDGKSDISTRRWSTRRNWLNESYHRSYTQRGIPLSISQRCDSMGCGRTGWRGWRNQD